MQTSQSFESQFTYLQERFDTMEPELEVTVRDPVYGVEGHIVVWNTAISREGPLPFCAKGGTRIRSDLSREEIKMLARNMAIKNAAAGLPLGGCKSGLNADSRAHGFEKKYRRFIELCKPFTYENGGIFGGFGFDIGAAPEHAVWACDTLKSTRSFTGKTVEMGGTDYDREGIAGLGVAESAAEILKLNRENLHDINFSIHGAGAMGAAVVRYFSELGANLSCISDPKFAGTWVFDHVISNQLLEALTTQNHSLGLKLITQQGRKISDNPDQALLAPCDVLFPCAIQHVINESNVEKVRARYIVEGANNPTTLAAYRKLFERKIHQIPDFIANSGGVISAYIELTSKVSDDENARTRAKVQEAKSFTRSTIKRNVKRIFELADKQGVSLRDAGLFIALEAVLKHETKV